MVIVIISISIVVVLCANGPLRSFKWCFSQVLYGISCHGLFFISLVVFHRITMAYEGEGICSFLGEK